MRIGGHRFRMRRQQPGIGLVMRTANAAAQLVQLGEAKMVGAFDDDGVGGGNVDPGFDDGGAHQHIEALMMEVIHHPLQFALPHLTVTDGDPRLRHQLRQLVGGFLDVLNVIKQIVDLAAAQRFAQDRLAHHQGVIFANEGLHRQAARRRRGDDRQIAHPAHRHVQRPRDRRGGEGQDIDIGAHRFDTLFMPHAKPVLFVDDQQPEIAQLHLALQQLVGADQDIDFAFRGLLEDLRLLFSAAEAGEHFDAYRPVGETIAEIVIVLLSQQGGRHQHRHLLVVLHGEEGGAHGHFGLAEAHIAAHQAVHGQRLAHIAEDGVDRLRLIRRGFKWETVAEQLILFAVVFKGKTRLRRALGIDIQQLGRHVAYFLSRFLSRPGPGIAAQLVQGGVFFRPAGVAADKMQGRYRNV